MSSEIVVAEPFDSENLPVTLLPEIQRFLRVANRIQIDHPRVAYICRFHVFEVAHKLDQTSSGCGVRQFKTSLLQRLAQDHDATRAKMTDENDACLLRRVCRQYQDYIIKQYGGVYTSENRKKMIKLHAIASVLSEVIEDPDELFESTRKDLYGPCRSSPADQRGTCGSLLEDLHEHADFLWTAQSTHFRVPDSKITPKCSRY